MAVNMKAFEDAMTAALKGPEKKKLKIEEHSFNVKKADISKLGDKIIVSGGKGHHISHHRRFLPDDQIMYGFEIVGGVIEELEIEVDKGGFVALAKKVKKIIEIAKEISEISEELEKEGKIIKGDAAKTAFHETKRLLDGSWEGEARFLIANIALRVAADV